MYSEERRARTAADSAIYLGGVYGEGGDSGSQAQVVCVPGARNFYRLASFNRCRRPRHPSGLSFYSSFFFFLFFCVHGFHFTRRRRRRRRIVLKHKSISIDTTLNMFVLAAFTTGINTDIFSFFPFEKKKSRAESL